MIGTIRKHSTWLWAVIIFFVIISFVYFFSPNAGRGGYSQEENYGAIDGVPVTRSEFNEGAREAMLAYFFDSGGRWPDRNATQSGFDIDQATYRRIFFARKVKEYNIHVDKDAVVQLANDLLKQLGGGKQIAFDVFVQKALGGHATVEDFERFVRHQLSLQQLVSVIGLSGDLVTPQELESAYVRQHEELSTQAAFFSVSNYVSSVPDPSPTAVAGFYTNQMADYRIPERVQVSYVTFPMSNYLAEADKEITRQFTNLTEVVDQVYRERGSNYYSSAKSPEEAKQKIREEVRHNFALREARTRADQFAAVLFEQQPKLENFNSLAKSNGLAVKMTEPFDQETGPSEMETAPTFVREAFLRTTDEPFGGPVIGEDGVHVIALNKSIPSEIPPLDAIRGRVIADYKSQQALQLARRAASDFSQTAMAALARGSNFNAVAAGSKMKLIAVPPFSARTRELPQVEEHVRIPQFKQLAFTTSVGKVSEAAPTMDGAVVIYVQQRLPVDPARMRIEMPDFIKEVRMQRRQEVLSMWFQKEGAKSLRDIPILQKQNSSAPGGSGS